MAITEEQYERIALWLDGQDVALGEAERAAADEIRRDEALLGAVEMRAPRGALDRASRRIGAELARPTRRLRIARFVAVTTAAAAAIILATALLMPDPAPVAPVGHDPDGETIAKKVETLIDEMEESIRPQMMVELLAADLESLEAEMLVTAEIGEMDLKINALENEIDSILLDPSAPWSFDDGV